MNTKPPLILALDQGTTSSRALLINQAGQIVDVAQKEFPQHFPQPGWVEHDPETIWDSQNSSIKEVISKSGTDLSQIAAIGITNQRETTIVWEKATGHPVYPAIVWQDRRTAETCKGLREQGYSDFIRTKTGLTIDPYFSATKLKWILDNVDPSRKRARNGELLFGTVDCFLLWRLTNGHLHATDITNASRTMLFNIHTLTWDRELLDLFNIPTQVLPEVKASSGLFEKTAVEIAGAAIPITGIAGDQQAALFGQTCFSKGQAKNTYGTGAFLMLNTGRHPAESKHNLLSTIAWKIKNEVTYALEGSVFIAGAAVQWLRDGLGIIQSSAEIEELANSVEDNGGVFFVPAFTGLGAPYWDENARGTLVGLTRGTTRAHIARATLEAIALQSMDVINAMKQDSKLSLESLRVDGGAAKNNLLMQIQADVLQSTLIRPVNVESTAMGAAYLAGLGVGLWNDFTELTELWQQDQLFSPHMQTSELEIIKNGWIKAISKAKDC